MTELTSRFTQAVEYARVAHRGQTRKGTTIPYTSHLLAVASLVLEHGGDEDQAIAGLLHDVIEDCGANHEAVIRAQFGDGVAEIVVACTDGTAEGKKEHADLEAKRLDWTRRKLAYLEHLGETPTRMLLVSGCDKLHNARSILIDMEDRNVGTKVFSRFTGGREGTLANYQSLANIFSRRGSPVAAQLESVVARMHKLAGDAVREPLLPPRATGERDVVTEDRLRG